VTRGKLTRSKLTRLKQLEELAERKLGAGTIVRAQRSGWVAERVDGAGNRTRVTGKTRSILEWFLNELPDATVARSA